MILNCRLKTTNKSLYIILYIGVICTIPFQKLSAQVELPVINDAVAYYLDGRTDECLNKYLEYFRLNENLDNKAKYKLALRLAFLAAWDGQSVNSQTFLAYSESLEKEVDQDSISLADKMLINGISKYNNSKFTEAGEYVLESIQNRTIKNRFEKAIQADSYGFLGLIYKTLKDDATAIRYYEQAIRIDRELNRKNIIANELTELAGSSIRSNPFNPDIDEMLKEALGTYTLNNDFKNIAFVNNEYGNMHQNRGNNPVALEYFITSSEIKETHKDNTNLDVTYNNIGAIYNTLGQKDSSLTYFRKAVDIAVTEGSNNLSSYYYNLGSHFGLMGQLDSSRNYIDLAIKELDRGIADPRLDLRALAERNTRFLKRIRHISKC